MNDQPPTQPKHWAYDDATSGALLRTVVRETPRELRKLCEHLRPGIYKRNGEEWIPMRPLNEADVASCLKRDAEMT